MSTEEITIVKTLEGGITRDPDYAWVPPMRKQPALMRGTQCGECGMKFEYDKSYGYHCSHQQCPMGWGMN